MYYYALLFYLDNYLMFRYLYRNCNEITDFGETEKNEKPKKVRKTDKAYTYGKKR